MNMFIYTIVINRGYIVSFFKQDKKIFALKKFVYFLRIYIILKLNKVVLKKLDLQVFFRLLNIYYKD